MPERDWVSRPSCNAFATISLPRAPMWLCMVFALAGCARSCACDDGDRKLASAARPPTPFEPDAALPAQDAAPLAAAPTPAVAVEIDTRSAQEVFPDLPSSEGRAQLVKLGAKLAKSTSDPAAKVAVRERLAPLLPQRIGSFGAQGAAIDGPTLAADKPLSGLARHYVSGKRELYVKITDTLQAPMVRGDLLAQLGAVGGPATGFVHGRLLAGYPATAQYYPSAKNAQVTVLVAARYLIELRLVPAESPQEAIELAQRLPLSGFGAPEARVSAELRADPSRATAVEN